MAKIISLLCRSAEQTNDTMNGLLMPQNKQALCQMKKDTHYPFSLVLL